jgi:hypothetical protein
MGRHERKASVLEILAYRVELVLELHGLLPIAARPLWRKI